MGASAVHAADKAQGEPIVIGVIEDRSGSATFYSQESVKAITLFAESINKGELAYMGETTGKEPGIQGRPIELIFEADENNANLTVVKSRRLVARGAGVLDRKSVVEGESVDVRVGCGGGRNIKKKTKA